jgi:RNA polymerase sigma factor (TIGR02999 family)
MTLPVTLLLQRIAAGDRLALDQVYSALYPELRRIAHARLYAQGRPNDMSTTQLVHENFLHMIRAGQISLADRQHFFTYAAKSMRNIIVDEARAACAEVRGGGATHVEFEDKFVGDAELSGGAAILRTHDALLALEALDPDLAQVVEMRYFGGYSEKEIAELQGVTERSVRRRWDKARSFLLVTLRGQ